MYFEHFYPDLSLRIMSCFVRHVRVIGVLAAFVVLLLVPGRVMADDIYNNISATNLFSTQIGNTGAGLRLAGQRFTTTAACQLQSVDLMLRKSASVSGYYRVDIFTDVDNNPHAYWTLAYIDPSILKTTFTKTTVNLSNLVLRPNTNYWLTLTPYNDYNGSGLEWAYTSTIYPAPTAYAYWSWSSTKFIVENSSNAPQVMRVVATVPAAPAKPAIAATNVTFIKTLNYETGISCYAGSGDFRAFFMKATDTGTPAVVDNHTYAANSVFGKGESDGNGWYCIYNGDATSISVSGLSKGTTYRVMVVEYNGEVGKELYNTTTSSLNPANVTTITECVSLPGNADKISGSATVCAGTFGSTYSVARINSATSYKWSYSGTGATIQGTDSIAILNFSDQATNGILTVQGQSDCGLGYASPGLSITVNPIPDAAGAITGPLMVRPGDIGVAYSVASIANAASYTWTYSAPSGDAVIHGNGARNITIDYGVNAVGGVLTVVGYNACGSGTISAPITIVANRIPDAAGVITGPYTACAGSLVGGFSVDPISYANTYIWEFSDASVAIRGNGTPYVSLDFPASAVNGTLTVKGRNSSGDGAVSATFPITVIYPPAAAGSITGISTVCAGYSNIGYSVAEIANATTYKWAYVGSGVTIRGSDKDVTLNFNGTASSGTLTVKGSNVCSDGVSSSFSIVVPPLPGNNGIISGFTNICAGTLGSTFNVSTLSSATSYIWNYSGSDFSIIGNDRSMTINFLTTATSGIISVMGQNLCGNGPSVELPITIIPLVGKAPDITGPAYICDRTITYTYQVGNADNATSYIWDYSGSGQLMSSDLKTATIRYPVSATSGNLTVKGHNSCGDGQISANYPITLGLYPAKPLLAGTAVANNQGIFCPGDLITCTNFNTAYRYKLYLQDNDSSDLISNKISLDAPGKWHLTVSATNDICRTLSDTLVVTVDSVEIPEVIKKTQGGVNMLIVNNKNDNFESYHWTMADNTPIAGLTDIYRQFLVLRDLTGSYAVHIVDKLGCNATSSPVVITGVALKSVTIYPTINEGNFTVEMNSQDQGAVTLRIVGSSGNVYRELNFQKSAENIQFPVQTSNLRTGSYIVEIMFNGSKEYRKMMVKH